MISKSLASSFSLQLISKFKIMYSLFSLFILLFLLQVILKNYEENNFDFNKTLSNVEKEYRKTFNLMIEPAEVGQECTLGNSSIISCCYKKRMVTVELSFHYR